MPKAVFKHFVYRNRGRLGLTDEGARSFSGLSVSGFRVPKHPGRSFRLVAVFVLLGLSDTWNSALPGVFLIQMVT